MSAVRRRELARQRYEKNMADWRKIGPAVLKLMDRLDVLEAKLSA